MCPVAKLGFISYAHGLGLWFMLFSAAPAFGERLIWSQTVRESDSVNPWSMAMTPDEQLWMVTESFSTKHNKHSFSLIKLDALGNIVWKKRLGGPFPRYELTGYGVAGASDNGSFLSEYVAASDQARIVRMDAGGKQRWAATLPKGARDVYSEPVQTADGGCLVIRSFLPQGKAGERALPTAKLYKLSSTGALEWERNAGTEGFVGRIVIPLADRGYLLVGHPQAQLALEPIPKTGWFARFDADGKVIWSNVAGRNIEWFNRVRTARDGGFLAIALRNAFDPDKDNLGIDREVTPWVAKLNDDGSIAWERILQAQGDGDIADVARIGKNEYFLLGSSDRSIWMAILDENGNRIPREMRLDRKFSESYGMGIFATRDGVVLIQSTRDSLEKSFYIVVTKIGLPAEPPARRQ